MHGSEPTRRAFLLGGLAIAGAGVMGGEGHAAHPPRRRAVAAPGVTIAQGTFRTAHWPGRAVGWKLASAARPVVTVLALHGLGGRGADWFDVMQVQEHLAGTGLAVVGVDGAMTYWHRRAAGPHAGTDTAAMIIEDLLPLLAARGLPTGRVGLLGTSMGGYGSLLIGSQLGPARVTGIATLAAALRTSPAGTSPLRFDDLADYQRHDVFARTEILDRIPLWLACGDRDEFREANEAFAARTPRATTVFDAGHHDDTWFRAHLGGAIAFLAAQARPV